MTAQALLDGVTAFAWLVVAYKFPSLRQQAEDQARRYYWLTLLCMALALTILLPPLYRTLDGLVGVPNLARLLGDGCALGASWSAQALLFHLNFPAEVAATRTRTIGIALSGALLLMVICFALAPLPDEATDFTGRYQSAPFIFEYRVLFLASLGMGMANAARLFWRYARLAGRPTLRLGLRLSAAAAALGLVYVAHEAWRVGAARFDLPEPVPNPNVVSQLLLATFITVGLVGATVSAWGRRLGLDALGPWLRAYRSLCRLYPLWLALYRANPAIALDPPASRRADLLDFRRVHFRLYRRVVEIHDGWLLLRPAMDARAVACAQRRVTTAALPDADARAVIDAAVLAVALRAPVARQTVPNDARELAPPASDDLQGEVEALERVARCYRRSPIVQAVAAQLAAQPGRRPAVPGKP